MTDHVTGLWRLAFDLRPHIARGNAAFAAAQAASKAAQSIAGRERERALAAAQQSHDAAIATVRLEQRNIASEQAATLRSSLARAEAAAKHVEAARDEAERGLAQAADEQKRLKRLDKEASSRFATLAGKVAPLEAKLEASQARVRELDSELTSAHQVEQATAVELGGLERAAVIAKQALAAALVGHAKTEATLREQLSAAQKRIEDLTGAIAQRAAGDKKREVQKKYANVFAAMGDP